MKSNPLCLLTVLLLGSLFTKTELYQENEQLTTRKVEQSSTYASIKLLTRASSSPISKPLSQKRLKRRNQHLKATSTPAILSVRQPRELDYKIRKEVTTSGYGTQYESLEQAFPVKEKIHIKDNHSTHNNSENQHLNEQINEIARIAIVGDESTENSALSKTSTEKLKSSRMIARLVAGHIQNTHNHTKSEVPNQTTSHAIKSKITHNDKPIQFQKKQSVISNLYTTHSFGPNTIHPKPVNKTLSTSEDDEVVLKSQKEFGNWDNGMLRLSEGSGKESKFSTPKKQKETIRKTLSDQIRDGKYGLIETELFQQTPKRPGVLSYLPNKETPNDDHFGGLDENDIWLAEDHLLVIKGGSLNEGDVSNSWSPIDNLDAPPRPIKIPPNPKVPPPFPIQLQKNGPIEFIGNDNSNLTSSFNIKANDTMNELAGKNIFTWPVPSQYRAFPEQGYIYPASYPQWLHQNQTYANTFSNKTPAVAFPGLGPFPVGHNKKNTSRNEHNVIDEEDPAQYYPPAYSFVYDNNYTDPVSPGPLVPGIVVPPPPDQFRLLEQPPKVTTLKGNTHARHRIYQNNSRNTLPKFTTRKWPKNTTKLTGLQPPHRHATLNNSQYARKPIIITPASKVNISQLPLSSLPILKSTKSLPVVDPVPVPVAVPIPVYTDESLYFIRPPQVTIPTTTKATNMDSSSDIYLNFNDYLENKPQYSISSLDNVLSSKRKNKMSSYSPEPKRINNAIKTTTREKVNLKYIPSSEFRPSVTESVIYITPKPSLGRSLKLRTFNNFVPEVHLLRETLLYYKNQQLNEKRVPQIANVNNIYEYYFDSSTNLHHAVQPIQSLPITFQSAPKLKTMQPLLIYSSSADGDNTFKDVILDESEIGRSRKLTQSTKLLEAHNREEYLGQKNRYNQYQLFTKNLSPDIRPTEREEQYKTDFQSSQRKILTTQKPLANSSQQIPKQQQVQRIMHHSNGDPTAVKERGFETSDYYTNPESETILSENNHLDENKFHNFIGYENAETPNIPRTPFRQSSQYYTSPEELQITSRQRPSVNSEVLVNYRKLLTPINAYSKYIAPSRKKLQHSEHPHASLKISRPAPLETKAELLHRTYSIHNYE